jgi:hypothetical protein
MLPDAGWAKVQELRAAITRFRSTGKPAYAHIELCSNKEYYLATACTKIYAIPSAILDVSGLAAEITFLRGSLDKLGVQAQFEGVGKYKNAPNQFTETGFTAPHREQMDAMLDSLYAEYLGAIAKGRGQDRRRGARGDRRRSLRRAGSEACRARGRAALSRPDRAGHQGRVTHLGGALPARGAAVLRHAARIALVYAVGDIIPGRASTGRSAASTPARTRSRRRSARRARTPTSAPWSSAWTARGLRARGGRDVARGRGDQEKQAGHRLDGGLRGLRRLLRLDGGRLRARAAGAR